jgi:TolB-like protein/Tfp pilus assembly protein PilF
MPEPNDGPHGGLSEADVATVRRELEKVLSSGAFQTSERLKNFLRYTVEQSIQGRADRIKEYSVGTDVFGRSASFDPRLDTIVRTEARKLRSRLATYYATEGKDDSLRIEFRKGSYAPFFRNPVFENPESDAAQPETSSLLIEPVPPPPDPSPDIADTKPLAHPANPTGRKIPLNLAVWAALACLAVITGSLIWYSHSRSSSPGGNNPSIAVLPFLNLSDDQHGRDDDFLSDGLTDELIDSLGRVPGLHVIGRTSAFQYKGQTADIRKIGRDLNVRNLLAGTVRRSGKQLRITAELDDTITGYRVWSESYDREFKDALSIQREISQSITSALGVRLSAGRLQLLDGSSPAAKPLNPEAHQAYLRGRFFWNKLNTADINRAIGYFQQALSIEPNYALAYEGLAHCYTQIPVFTTVLPTEVIPKIRSAALKALELAPTLGEANLDLAVAYDYDFAWSDAEREFRKGLELNPGDAVAHRLYAVHLITTGQLDQAIEENKIGLNLDPVSPFMAQGLARAYYFARRYDLAIEEYRRALTFDPNFRLAHWGLGAAYISNKMFPQGIAEMRQMLRFDVDASAASRLGYTYAVTGDVTAARKLLTEMLQSKYGPLRGHDVARVYIGLGDNAHAFEWLKKAVDEKEGYLYLKVDPAYDPLRADPRFEELLRKMGLT